MPLQRTSDSVFKTRSIVLILELRREERFVQEHNANEKKKLKLAFTKRNIQLFMVLMQAV